MAAWIVLHDHDDKKDRRYFVQVSHISYFINRQPNNTAVVYFGGDLENWITVKESPAKIMKLINEDE